MLRKIVYIFAVCLMWTQAFSAHQPHGAMLRNPHVSGTDVVFIYADKLWLVSKEGGMARPLANPPGNIITPRFSPDGKTVAFGANYEGEMALYTLPVEGGVPFRVTYYPSTEALSGWSPDGKDLLFFTFGMGDHPRTTQAFKVSATGGLPEKLPVPYGANPAISPDGQWLAYTPFARDHRTWKRYRGGMASDIWLFNLKTGESKRVTDWEGTDSFPMWHGDNIYYLSDRGPKHKLNIWKYDTVSGQHQQVTSYEEYDVKYPSIGPNDIVYQNGANLCVLNLQNEEPRNVEVSIPGDRIPVMDKWVEAGSQVRNGAVSTTGQRVSLEARGDIWSLPAKHGSPFNLTRTDDVNERSPSWSPDKEWICFFSDRDDSYDLYQMKADGSSAEAEKLTDLKARFLYTNQWSSNSRYISFWNRGGTLMIYDREQKKIIEVDTDPALQRRSVSFSHDNRFVAYSKGNNDNGNSSIFVFNIETGEKHRLTSYIFDAANPVFDRDGKYLFFSSHRFFKKPLYEDMGTTWIYAGTDQVYAMVLDAEGASPLEPIVDKETVDEKKASEPEKKDSKKGKDKKKKEDDKKKEEEPKLKIDFAGIASRTVALPFEPANYRNLAVNDSGHLLVLKNEVGSRDGEILILDLKDDKRKPKSVLKSCNGFDITADGKKLLVFSKGTFAVIDAKPSQKMSDIVSTKGMNSLVNPAREWNEIFHEAWRFYRDFFYDPNMHHVDWEAILKQYEPMMKDCNSRSDLSYVIREMISELNVGHAYYRPSPEERMGPRKGVGLLGATFKLNQGAYQIDEIIQGGPWDEDGRGPLSQPGVKVKEGDYILSVNGLKLDPAKSPWEAFVGLGGETVSLKVSSTPKMEDAHEVTVTLLKSEREIKFRSWVYKKWKYVQDKTNGEVGYIYVPNTGVDGQNELVRQFYGQIGKKALIIDERWNGGGQIPTRFVELLNRPAANYWALRDGKDWPWPPDAHFGPKCMLINGLAGSGGDYFPYWFRQAGVGKLIGTRTWGGLVGISGEPALLDGAGVTIPSFAFYEMDGTWGIEGHGVDPDIEVVDDPALMKDGGDPQLDRAIEEMQKEIKEHPYKKPKRPDYPKRNGMGVLDAEK